MLWRITAAWCAEILGGTELGPALCEAEHDPSASRIASAHMAPASLLLIGSAPPPANVLMAG
jgi:hypothetical protein